MSSKTSTLLRFPIARPLDNTIIAFVDLQQEFTAKGRAYAVADTERCLLNCRKLLKAARSKGLIVAHFRLVKQSGFFNASTSFSHWLEDFRPRANEMLFERDKPSLFSNKAFVEFIENIASPEIILVGLTGQQGCLASSIEAAQRDYKALFVHDASASQSIGGYSEGQCHDILTGVIGSYADVVTTKDVLLQIDKTHCPNTEGTEDE